MDAVTGYSDQDIIRWKINLNGSYMDILRKRNVMNYGLYRITGYD